MYFLCLFLTVSLICSSDLTMYPVVGFSVSQEQYVDCLKWSDTVKAHSQDFSNYSISLKDCKTLSSMLSIGMHDKRSWPTQFEPNYITRLKEHAVVSQEKAFGSTRSISDFEKLRSVQFLCFLVSAQLYKLINRIQLETGSRIASYNGKFVDELFKQMKDADFDSLANEKTYGKMVHDGKRFFDMKKIQSMIAAIRVCDSSFLQTPSSSEYEKNLIFSIQNCFIDLDKHLSCNDLIKSKL